MRNCQLEDAYVLKMTLKASNTFIMNQESSLLE